MSYSDPDIVVLYNQLAETHRHADGPWLKMRDAVVDFTKATASLSTGNIRILDIATGPGEPAATIAAALPHASILATDVSEAMVTAAKVAIKHLANVTTAVADVQDLSSYADGSFDVVTCCYGFMYPGDKACAVREAFRVLKPGGLLVATTWETLKTVEIGQLIVEKLSELPRPSISLPAPMNVMSLADSELFRTLLVEAGFERIEGTTSSYPIVLGSDKSVQFKMGTIVVKEAIDAFGAVGWNTAESVFWEKIGSYAQTDVSGSLFIPGNTFRMTLAFKSGY